MDVNVRVSGLEKLLDYAASGIGAIAGPIIANWRASKEGKARLTSSRIDAEVRRIETESNVQSLQIIADAQAKARQSINTTIESGQGMMEITRDDIAQSIEFQGRKRLANARFVVEDAADELGDKEVSDHEPDPDWTARFFNDIQDVSSKEMQSLWARVLAGEVEKPGSTSIQTLGILRNLTKATGGLFRKLCSTSVALRLVGDQFWDARVPSLGGSPVTNSLHQYGLGFDNLNVLNEHGLIIAAYDSSCDYGICIGGVLPVEAAGTTIRIPFSFQNRYWVLIPTIGSAEKKEFRLSGVALTRSGRELAKVVDLAPMNEYSQALIKFFQTNNLQMTEVDSATPKIYRNPLPTA